MFSTEQGLQVTLESMQLIFALAVLVLIISAARRAGGDRKGWGLIVAGFSLFAFASVLALSGSLLGPSAFQFLGGTSFQYFLERIVGYLGGSLLLFVGVVRCLGVLERRKIPWRKKAKHQAGDIHRFLEANPDAAILHWDGKVEHCNEAAARFLGYRDSISLVGLSVNSFIHEKDHSKVAARMQALVDGGGRVPVSTLAMIRHDGTSVAVEAAMSMATYEERPILYSTLRDVSLRQDRENVSKRSESRYRDFAEIGSDWLWEMDEDLRFSYVSDKISSLRGIVSARILGKRRQDLTEEAETDPKWISHLADLEARRPFRHFTYSVADTSGRQVVLQVSGVPIFSDDGTFIGYRGTGNNITQQYEALKQQEGSAGPSGRDALTGLAGNKLFLEQLNHAMARIRRGDLRLAVLSCDLDDFLAVYNSYGEDYCNRVLVEAGHRIKRSVRETDLIARHDQDVFVVLLEDLPNTVGGQIVAEKLLYEMLAPFDRSSGEKVNLGCSIGVAHYSADDSVTAEQIVAQANKAVARAKRAGKGTFRVYDPEMDGGNGAAE